jgi:hypothetical protein
MFKTVKKQMQDAFTLLVKNQSVLFITDLDKDVLWNAYLDGFIDPVEKQEHNCNCCRSFIRNYGNVVAIVENKICTLWNFIPSVEIFEPSIEKLHNLVINSCVKDVFISDLSLLGTDHSVQRFTSEEGKMVALPSPITWNHFSLSLPTKFVNSSAKSRESVMGVARDNRNVFKRSLDEISQDAIETVLELIAQNSLYKGEENKGVLTEFLKCKKEYDKVVNKDNYCWSTSSKISGALAKIRNTSIGTLLTDITEGKELDKAVETFEKMVAPTNYKRPKSLVTKRMIEDAEKTVKELGFEESLGRRFAITDDISVENVLFVNRDTKKAMGVFSEMKEDVIINPKTLKKVEEINIDDFVKNVLPTVKGVQLLLENEHLNNLCSVITEQTPKSPILFKWNNPFSWSYTNAVTDSIKEQVKAAGGKVEGELRISLSWFNYDDLDLHIVEPNGNIIYYGAKASPFTGGQLDVDMNAGSGKTRKAVENVIYANKARIYEGRYIVKVKNFSQREKIDAGFIIEVECKDELSSFSFDKSPGNQETQTIVEFTYSKKDGVKLSKEVKTNVLSKEKWGLNTNKFHKVSMMLHSPNHWSENIGNRHTFFILEGAKNDENARGFFNEFLSEEMTKHRKVFEVLGGKLKVAPADKQLSGVGFSSTQRNSVICKVEGKFERLLKINF